MASANLAEDLVSSAQKNGERTALRLDDLRVSYSDLEHGSGLIAGILRAKGLQPGDCVGVMLPNVHYFPLVFYGVLRCGAIVVPMNPLLKGREVAYYLGDSGASLILAWHECAEAAHAGSEQAGADCVLIEPGAFESMLAAAPAVATVTPRTSDDTAMILYTSGTTGAPKGAELTHGNFRYTSHVSARIADVRPATVALGALPLFHAFGLTCGLITPVAAGASVTLLPRFHPARALELIERDQVTVFLGVPTMYVSMLALPDRARYDTSSLSLCLSGGAAIPVEVLHQFEAAFGCTVLEGYGLSESCAFATFTPLGRERKAGSVGLPAEGMRITIVDDAGRALPPGQSGEVFVRGPSVMKGYWNRPDATAAAIDEDGWLRTGDIGRTDEDGYLYLLDRKKDLIIRGGYNIYPGEIEQVLFEHPAVREAAVIGTPHPSLGEEVGAAVSLKPGIESTPEEIRAFVKERVAAYKYPRLVWIVEELPKGPTGKILKREIQVPDEVSGRGQ